MAEADSFDKQVNSKSLQREKRKDAHGSGYPFFIIWFDKKNVGNHRKLTGTEIL